VAAAGGPSALIGSAACVLLPTQVCRGMWGPPAAHAVRNAAALAGCQQDQDCCGPAGCALPAAGLALAPVGTHPRWRLLPSRLPCLACLLFRSCVLAPLAAVLKPPSLSSPFASASPWVPYAVCPLCRCTALLVAVPPAW
jgi:hypothetical protein